MGASFIPGLQVSRYTTLLKRRILPLKGDVLKKVGDHVGPNDVVAQTFLPGKVHPINVANMLGVQPADVPGTMLLKEGQTIKAGEHLAMSKSFFGFFKNYASAKVAGTIENISAVTGQVMLREDPTPVAVKAYVEGQIVDVIPGEGVVVETAGTYIQGIFGIGSETHGDIAIAAKDPAQVLAPADLLPEHKGKIVVAGSFANLETIKKAVAVGVKALVVGGIDARDLVDFMGYDLGVAITGSEKLGLTLVVTEGFGKIAMASRTFDLLRELQGKRASVNGATQIRAGVIRPEIIVTLPEGHFEGKALKSQVKPLEVGDTVRIIREPYFGEIGNVTALPSELYALESGSKARVLEVVLENGKTTVLPRANTEMITV